MYNTGAMGWEYGIGALQIGNITHLVFQEEACRMTLCFYERTKEEVLAPLTNPHSPVYNKGLHLRNIRTVTISDSRFRRCQMDKGNSKQGENI